MDTHNSSVIYLDRRAWEQRRWTRSEPPERSHASHHEPFQPSASEGFLAPGDEVDYNIRSLLIVFPQVSVHRTSTTCISEIESVRKDPSSSSYIILIINVPSVETPPTLQFKRASRSPSPSTADIFDADYSMSGDLYGMDFLIHLSFEVQSPLPGPRIIPIVLLNETVATTSAPSQSLPSGSTPKTPGMHSGAHSSPFSRLRYFEAGAVDVLTSPISSDRAQSLPAHTYRISVERGKIQSEERRPKLKKRKTSWVGTKDDRLYMKSKDAMVSELMDHIVNPDRDSVPIDVSHFSPDNARSDEIAEAFGDWSFDAHILAEEELVYGAVLILEHTLKMPELEKWRISRDRLTMFLIATRSVYNKSVLYHNFRHACDVLQACFFFLSRIGAIPPFPPSKARSSSIPSSPLGSLIQPFDALVLLISALGHDVGHPGVNNGFLVMVNAPLAQLYNDKSVLESFHCAAYSQILRRYWKSAFEDAEIRKMMILAITATDMGLHPDYMMQMGSLQDTAPKNAAELSGWTKEKKVEARELLLCLIIKCADICNVARRFNTSSRWADLLMQEFAAQGEMEKDLHLAQSALFGGPPDPSSLLQKSHSQLGFMQVFGYPLFGGISKLLPGLGFTVEEIDSNRVLWQSNIDVESGGQNKKDSKRFDDLGTQTSRAADGLEKHVSHVEDAGLPPRKISIHFSASISSTRRASGGTPSQLLWPSDGPKTRRSSLGPTVIPDALTRRKRSSGE